MSSDAFLTRKLASQERGILYTVFLALESLIALAVIFAALRIWGIDLLELISQFFSLINLDTTQLPSVIASILPQVEEAIDPLAMIVETIIFFLITLGLGFTIWFAYNVWATWQWRIWGYRTILTLSVGAIMFTILVLESIPLTLLAIVHLAFVIVAAHTKFYPEYKGQSPESLIRDLRVIRVISQIIFAFVIFFVLKLFWVNVYATLAARNALPTFDFLFRRAGFQISQSPDWYSSNSRYGDAFVVGVVNTLQVVSVGLVLATILGVLLGIFLLSGNWLIRTISRAYVEILRNTPLLVQLIFWYFVLWLSFPAGSLAVPKTSVMVLQLRYIVYLIAFLGIAYYVWRYSAPPRTMTGFFTGILILEIAFRFLGDSYSIVIILAILGAALIAATMREGTIPPNWAGLVRAIGIIAIIQLVGHILLDGMQAAGIIENARYIYGEVDPVMYLGPNVFGIPRFTQTSSFWIFGLVTQIGIFLALILHQYWGRIIDRTGADIPRTFYALLIVIVFAVVAWIFATRNASMDTFVILHGVRYILFLLIGILVLILAYVFVSPSIKTSPLFTTYMTVIIAVFSIGGWYLSGQTMNLETQIIVDGDAVPLSQAIDEGLLDETQLLQYQTDTPIAVQLPTLNRFGTRVQQGVNISPSYMALLIGLVIYTSAFIGEIVRAGIQSVPYGQIEAARALGLSTSETLQMIVLPQALRVIIPPMGNQYLNLSKNSSLATAIAFADTYQVGQTIMNQSGQSITGFFLVLLVYLTLSLIISLFMNYINSRFQLVTR